jgi:hypothetical protein
MHSVSTPLIRARRKTHTMFGVKGNPKLRGVIPRAADALFDGIADSDDLDEVTIKCSFLEVS